jgi:two-component system chemotaxis response regulator CheY
MTEHSNDPVITRVLIVDDAASIRALLRSTLPLHGFEIVAEADRASTGIELARAEQPDVIVLDVQMPQVNGVEAIAPMKAECPTARILMYSSHDEHTMRDEALKLGADAYIDKLAPISQMADEMHRLVDSPRV